MSSDLEKLARKFLGSGHSEIADGASALAELARKVHAPETFLQPFDIPAVSDKIYLRTREILARKGLRFVVAINPVSINRLVTDEGVESSLGYMIDSEEMRSSVPPQIEVAINPGRFRIEGSNGLSTEDQFKKIKDQEAILRSKLPKDIRAGISILRPRHASILVQFGQRVSKERERGAFY
ncbi:MAG: hypothetical protein AAB662_00515 [Patescibacteria group bacterium]